MQFLVRIIIYRIIVRRIHWLQHWLLSTVTFTIESTSYIQQTFTMFTKFVHHPKNVRFFNALHKYVLLSFNYVHVPRMTNYMETSEAPGFRPVRPGGRNSNKRRSPMLVIPLETKDFSELFAQNCPSLSFVMPSFDDSSNRTISHVSTHPFDATVIHRPEQTRRIVDWVKYNGTVVQIIKHW